MPRPSRNLEQALLQSGRELYPLHGCSGLSLRLLCTHAGVNTGMFHYHFQSKENFLSVLLQSLYDEVFVQLQVTAEHPGSPCERLRQTLNALARLLRSHGAAIGRVWTDAGSGESVAKAFLQRNAPRHMQLLMALLDEAARSGEIAPAAPMQRFGFLMGAVMAPMLLVPVALQMEFMPTAFVRSAATDVMSDSAIAERVDRALAALALPGANQLHYESIS
jgi:AcrR family transcriptional regulator